MKWLHLVYRYDADDVKTYRLDVPATANGLVEAARRITGVLTIQNTWVDEDEHSHSPHRTPARHVPTQTRHT